jgi:hypothetical protein
MAFGTVTTQVNIADAVGPQPDATSYIVILAWNPIVEGAEPYEHTVAVSVVDAEAGPVSVSRGSAPLANGPMYIRAYGLSGAVKGPLSDEIVHNYDFRPGAPTVTQA